MVHRTMDDYLDMQHVLSFIPLRHHMTVAHIRCGSGQFTIPLAKALWGGKVYAVDTREEMLEAVRQRAKEARLGNIDALKFRGNKLPLEPNSLDGALLVSAINGSGVADKAGLFKAITGTLTKNAWLAVVETYAPSEDADSLPDRHDSEEQIVRLGTDAGLQEVLRRVLDNDHYLVVLRK